MPKLGSIDNGQSDSPNKIIINVDGSGSMIGYVHYRDSNYLQVITAITNSSILFKEGLTEYHRIGDHQPLSRDDFRKDAISPGFYEGDSNYQRVTSPIQEAIQPPLANESQLTVIVTDLEGDDGALISERLRQYYFTPENRNKDYTVGVWAVKSQFQGNVYDPKTGTPKFYYDTKDKGFQDYRPFYVLFIGKYAHIKQAFDDLTASNPNLEENSEMVIFPTNNILLSAVSLGNLQARENNSTLPTNNQIKRLFALDDNNIVVQRENDESPYELLGIIHEEDNPITISYNLPFPLAIADDKTDNYSLIQDSNNLKLITKTRVFTFEKNTEISELPTQASPDTVKTEVLNSETNNIQPEPQNYFAESSDPNLQNGLTINRETLAITSDNQNYSLNSDILINLNNLPNPQVYLFEVDLILDDLDNLDWWEQWDAQKAVGKDGSKTENIFLFLNTLKRLSLDSLGESNNPRVIGRLCFGVDKD